MTLDTETRSKVGRRVIERTRELKTSEKPKGNSEAMTYKQYVWLKNVSSIHSKRGRNNSCMMSVWCHVLILCCWLLNSMDASDPSPALLKSKYNNSFYLTRSTRTRVQQLLTKYKEQQLGDKNFQDRNQQLRDLPLLSTDYHSWFQLTEMERLHAAFRDMQTYSNKLEWKRKQIEKEEQEQIKERGKSSLSQSIWHVQLDLRDLMGQVRAQISHNKNSGMKPTSATTTRPSNPDRGSLTPWDSRVEGYLLLRDLDLYLTKLARDFLLLGSKTSL